MTGERAFAPAPASDLLTLQSLVARCIPVKHVPSLSRLLLEGHLLLLCAFSYLGVVRNILAKMAPSVYPAETNPSPPEKAHPSLDARLETNALRKAGGSAAQSAAAKSQLWAKHMPTIKRLYVDEAKTLEEVMDVMETVHNFQASYDASSNENLTNMDVHANTCTCLAPKRTSSGSSNGVLGSTSGSRRLTPRSTTAR